MSDGQSSAFKSFLTEYSVLQICCLEHSTRRLAVYVLKVAGWYFPSRIDIKYSGCTSNGARQEKSSTFYLPYYIHFYNNRFHSNQMLYFLSELGVCRREEGANEPHHITAHGLTVKSSNWYQVWMWGGGGCLVNSGGQRHLARTKWVINRSRGGNSSGR